MEAQSEAERTGHAFDASIYKVPYQTRIYKLNINLYMLRSFREKEEIIPHQEGTVSSRPRLRTGAVMEAQWQIRWTI